MAQVVLHLDEKYIAEDLEYYFSGERDKNNQVRPDKSIYSMTPLSQHININFDDGRVGNFFYPVLPEAIDRIYIGISVSLFANHWGASFLLELLKQVRPGGDIVLPVYPEGQAHEKDYWSRSFLENIFLSRQRWTGFSNITAENDGVMSLRVGRKWPEPMPSSIEWFYKERSNLLLASLQSEGLGQDINQSLQREFSSLCQLIWNEYSTSAVTEKIISDLYGKNSAISVAHVGCNYGLLVNDLILSPYVNVEQGASWHVGGIRESIQQSVSRHFTAHTGEQHQVRYGSLNEVSVDNARLIILSHVYTDNDTYKILIKQLWDSLDANGALIIQEDFTGHPDNIQWVDSVLSELGELKYYSSIAACQIRESVELSQYSLAVEENLRAEKTDKSTVFRVVQKMSS
jgi:hypothetical protein